MKLRTLKTGLLAVLALTVMAPLALAQDDKETLYTNFSACYTNKERVKMESCVETGKKYMALTKDSTEDKEYYDFVKAQVERMEKRIVVLKEREEMDKNYANFNAAITGKRWADVFTSGKAILAKEQDNLDVMFVLASIGFDNLFGPAPDTTYVSESTSFAKLALKKIDEGKTSPTWGSGAYGFKTKENAQGWLNYYIGRMMTFQKKDAPKDDAKELAISKEAAPYFYKALKYNSDVKKDFMVQRGIASYYLNEYNKSVEEYSAKEKMSTEDTLELKAMRELQMGYADRALDAFGRAYNTAKADTKTPKATLDYLNKIFMNFYSVRFKDSTGAPAYLTGLAAKAQPDPSTTVSPIMEVTPAPATTTGATPKPATTATTTTGGATKPAATNGTATKPATTGTGTTATKPAATTTKPVTSKPATTPKKPVKKTGR